MLRIDEVVRQARQDVGEPLAVVCAPGANPDVAVVLCARVANPHPDQPHFCTHVAGERSLEMGHYDLSWDEAVADFDSRVARWCHQPVE